MIPPFVDDKLELRVGPFGDGVVENLLGSASPERLSCCPGVAVTRVFRTSSNQNTLRVAGTVTPTTTTVLVLNPATPVYITPLPRVSSHPLNAILPLQPFPELCC